MAEQRYQAILAVIEDGLSVTEVAGEIVDVHLRDGLVEIWSGNDLIRTVVRDNERSVRKKRASKPAQT